MPAEIMEALHSRIVATKEISTMAVNIIENWFYTIPKTLDGPWMLRIFSTVIGFDPQLRSYVLEVSCSNQ
jgi:hypothetical protein